jgi:hypothetical protein
MNNPQSTKLRIVTGIRLTVDVEGVALDHQRDRKHLSARQLLSRLAGADAIVMTLPSRYTALLCWLAKLRSPGTRVVYYDVNIPIAASRWDRLKRRVYLELLRRADLILTLHAQTAEYSRLLRLPPDRLQYVGFKSNSWEDKAAIARGEATSGSGGYVLACGRSYRDFETFTRAMAEAGVPARILLTQGSLEGEGSIPPSGSIPENVELIQHDGTRVAWLEALLGARIVVVPLRGDVIQPAGVSVYLEAMNLSRPVIVTDGPATRSMLNDSIAGVVPPGDSSALAREVLRVWRDDELRNNRIVAAQHYVRGLGGVDRLSRDILRATLALLGRGEIAVSERNHATAAE